MREMNVERTRIPRVCEIREWGDLDPNIGTCELCLWSDPLASLGFCLFIWIQHKYNRAAGAQCLTWRSVAFMVACQKSSVILNTLNSDVGVLLRILLENGPYSQQMSRKALRGTLLSPPSLFICYLPVPPLVCMCTYVRAFVLCAYVCGE